MELNILKKVREGSNTTRKNELEASLERKYFVNRSEIKMEEETVEYDFLQLKKGYDTLKAQIRDKRDRLYKKEDRFERIRHNARYLNELSDSQISFYCLIFGEKHDGKLVTIEDFEKEEEEVGMWGFSLDSISQDPAFQKIIGLYKRRVELLGRNREKNKGKETIRFYGSPRWEFGHPRGQRVERELQDLREEHTLPITISGGETTFPVWRDTALNPLIKNLLLRRMNELTYNSILEGTHPLIAEYSHRLDEIEQQSIERACHDEGRRGYDYTRAREIREKEGLSQKKLEKILRITTKNLITTIERGRRSPKGRELTRDEKKYFGWLAEKGYNPFILITSSCIGEYSLASSYNSSLKDIGLLLESPDRVQIKKIWEELPRGAKPRIALSLGFHKITLLRVVQRLIQGEAVKLTKSSTKIAEWLIQNGYELKNDR